MKTKYPNYFTKIQKLMSSLCSRKKKQKNDEKSTLELW